MSFIDEFCGVFKCVCWVGLEIGFSVFWVVVVLEIDISFVFVYIVMISRVDIIGRGFSVVYVCFIFIRFWFVGFLDIVMVFWVNVFCIKK